MPNCGFSRRGFGVLSKGVRSSVRTSVRHPVGCAVPSRSARTAADFFPASLDLVNASDASLYAAAPNSYPLWKPLDREDGSNSTFLVPRYRPSRKSAFAWESRRLSMWIESSSVFRATKNILRFVAFFAGLPMGPPIGTRGTFRVTEAQFPRAPRPRKEPVGTSTRATRMRRRCWVLPVTVVPSLPNIPLFHDTRPYFPCSACPVVDKASRGPWETGDPCNFLSETT